MALSGAGFTVYPINPRAVARYRERHGRAGGKSDPGDAAILANVLRTDKHMHRPLPAVSEHGSTVKMLARQHQEASWALNQDRQPAPLGPVGVLPSSIEGVPEPEAPCGPGRSGRGVVTRSGPQAHPPTPRQSSSALWPRRPPPGWPTRSLPTSRPPLASASTRGGSTRPHHPWTDRDHRINAQISRRARSRTQPRVRRPPDGTHPAVSARTRPDTRGTSTGRDSDPGLTR